MLQAIAHGAAVRRATQVTGGKRTGDCWLLETSSGKIAPRVVVNAAGLYGDCIESIAREAPFSIRPRKGQFAVFDKTAYALVRSIVLPVPTQFKDYQIEALPDRRWITVGGIRSTGLTSALGIAMHVAGLYARHFGRLDSSRELIWAPVPNLCEERTRRYQEANAGEIVCHWELVTRQEIEAALSGPLPAGDLGGLKRRTRCMMGRAKCGARTADCCRNVA